MKPRVLVVEDERVVALDLEHQLQALDFEVVGIADHAAEVMELVHARQPDLVLMDIRIQGALDGIDLAHELRARYELPVVFLTGNADEVTLQRALAAEPYGYVLKPFELRTLEATLETALFRRRAERRGEDLRRWLADVLRSLPAAVVATDCEGRVAFLNAAAEDVLGRTLPDALLCPLDEVLGLDPAEGPLASTWLRSAEAPPARQRRTVHGVCCELSLARLRRDAPEETAGLVAVIAEPAPVRW